MLKAGEKAPDFTLDTPTGSVTLSSLAGKSAARPGYVVLYFYPKDKTPGCTREGQAFSALAAAFAKAGAKVFGVSKDTVTMHASFAASAGITVPLLSDPDLRVHRAYGAYGEKTMYGKKVEGTIRSTFVVAPDGTLARVFPSVKVDGHADAVLAAVQAYASGGGAAAAPPAKKAAAKKAAPAKKAGKPAAKKAAKAPPKKAAR
jgi:peroxiredoxin Q/BCP